MFSDVYDLKSLCNKLDINFEDAKFVLFRRDNYVSFSVPKKNGGERVISSPLPKLKSIQLRIKIFIEDAYKAPDCVNGFVSGKSTITNAQRHIGNDYLMGIDLENFFPTINFYRVKNLFRSNPFNADEKVASLLANLVTFNNQLPQGSCISPLITNMICRKLDHRITRYCENNDAIYTRYADDITISFKNRTDIKKFYNQDDCEPSLIIKEIIKEEGFIINKRKTHLSLKGRRKEVTGIVINKFLNVPKKYFKTIRSILHDCEKNGIEQASKHYFEKRNLPVPNNCKTKFVQIIKGMFTYYENIVNKDACSRDRYINIAKRFNILLKYNFLPIHYSIENISDDAVYMLNTIATNNCILQGTIFRVNKYLITCKHCLVKKEDFEKFNAQLMKNEKDALKIISKYKFSYGKSDGNMVSLGIPYLSKKYDLAVFKCEDNYLKMPFINISNNNPKIRDDVSIIGFPDYEVLDSANFEKCKIKGTRVMGMGRLGLERQTMFTLNTSILSGYSGAPVLNEAGDLIGIIEYGEGDASEKLKKGINAFASSYTIKETIKEMEELKYFN